MKSKILIFISIICITASATTVYTYADSNTYEHKYYDVTIDGYVHYGHQIITGECQVFYCLLDNGVNQAFVPIIYSSTSSPPVKIQTLGATATGSTIDEAKALSDTDDKTNSVFNVIDVSEQVGQTCYLYNTTTLSFPRYGVSSTRSALVSDSDKYYYNASLEISSIDMYINALKEYLNGNLNDFEIIDNKYIELVPNQSINDIDVIECTKIIVSMLSELLNTIFDSPLLLFIGIAIISGSIGLYSACKNSL